MSNKNIFFILFFVLSNINCLGQKHLDFSLNYNFRTSLSNAKELNSKTQNIESRYFKDVSPSFCLFIERINRKLIYGFSYERGELWIHNGLRSKKTIEHKYIGAGTYDGLSYNQLSLNFGYKIFEAKKIEQSISFSFCYLLFKENNNTSAFSTMDVKLDTNGSGNIAEKSIVFIDDYNFKRKNNILIGLRYNLIYKISKKIYLDFNFSYNQGLLNVYSAYASANIYNYNTGYSDFFEQTTNNRLSNFSLGIGIKYRLKAHNRVDGSD